jgi:hypothetical protein
MTANFEAKKLKEKQDQEQIVKDEKNKVYEKKVAIMTANFEAKKL